MNRPLIVTQGDPTGVGPEIILKALFSEDLAGLRHPVVVAGDRGVLQRAASVLGLAMTVTGESEKECLMIAQGRQLRLWSLTRLAAEGLRYGHPDEACGRAMIEYVTWACDRCLQGEAAGMVTAPINKAAIRAAGFDFPGHTELLAHRCGTGRVVMMLAGSRLRVCLVTTHLALSEVPQALSREKIVSTLRIVSAAFRRHFGLKRPRLAVLALNPHAGESGHFGDEEDRLIRPAIAEARAEGIDATGPHSADTLFHFAVQGAYDGVVCMYHDQGLIPLKLLHFEDGVNVTLGLPIVRTSVDHGTAYDLAGTGRASAQSLVAAIRMADDMATHTGGPAPGHQP